MSDRFRHVIEGIDRLNSEDPRGYELLYSYQLSDWVTKLNPQASELLRIAARGQHVQRWKSPRSAYPMDRAGYLRWREDLKRFHAKTVTDLMAQAGYTEDDLAYVRSIMLKKNLKADPEAQTLEDALCLVFLASQLEDFRKKETEEKMIDILRKSWGKMSEKGREMALTLPYSTEQKILLTKALESA